MERRMEQKAPKCGRTMRQNGRGDAVLSLPPNEQLYTRSCARCGGLLVNEWYYDSHTSGEHNVETLRCVQCGYRVDPVILQNQTRPSVERKGVRQGRRKSSAKAAVLSEVA
jgi:C4-type Zn-finger protein